MPESTFGSLFDDTADAQWAPGADVRNTARRAQVRARVTSGVAAVVAVATLGAGAWAVNDRNRAVAPPFAPSVPSAASSGPPSAAQTPSTVAPSIPATPTTVPPSTTPTRRTLTSVPVDAMLRPTDAGPGRWNTTDNSEADGDWSFAAVIGYCPARPSGYVEPAHRRTRSISRSTTGPSDHVISEVTLYRRGGAVGAFDYYRSGAVACARHQVDGIQFTVKILAEGFAGERSMLVESRSEHGRGLWVFVVEGDLMSQLSFQPQTTEYGKQLAGRAAKRMCDAQRSC